MGISGIFKEIGPGERQSLLALSAAHHATHSRPFRLAIDTSIWLFQIQASKGGSNPALRTFYYRLLRLLTHNIHPLFVFDGPNKPTFKRNKKVGGPGVRVASVPEFLAKQLLKELGFPWHVAPGEAEAECAVLQREGVVDAVMSEDVDTLMFGSGVTIRNWTAEGKKGKVPTHVNVYRAEDTQAKSGLDREGMVLVAMMSGGDYLVEGIPGCGPRVACDAARAGFGRELCEIARRKDVSGLERWRERLQREINTNESKFFTRKNKLVIPADFPSREVLGYYTHPCVSSTEKVERLRESLRWDQDIDFVALRNFTADAFDWRCISGAKKFVRNLAPAMLVRELRLRDATITSREDSVSTFQQHIAREGQEEEEEEEEKALVSTIHGKRNHASTDNSLEYRISFTPMNLVPIDLSIEDEDDGDVPSGGGAEDLLSEADVEWATMPSSTPAPGEDEEEDETSTTKTRGPSLYDPTQPEKLWLLADFLKRGCPWMVRMYEEGGSDPKAILKARREARAKARGDSSNLHAAGKKLAGKGKKKAVGNDMPANALLAYATVTKSSQEWVKDADVDVDVHVHVEGVSDVIGRAPLRDLSPRTSRIRANSPQKMKKKTKTTSAAEMIKAKNNVPVFQRMNSQWLSNTLPSESTVSSSLLLDQEEEKEDQDLTPKPAATKKSKATNKSKTQTTILNPDRPFAPFAKKKDIPRTSLISTPRKKRPSTEDLELFCSGGSRSRSRSKEVSSVRSQRTINSYFSPTPTKKKSSPPPLPAPPRREVISLLSSSPVKGNAGMMVGDVPVEMEMELPASVTKRRGGRRRVVKRARTAPVMREDYFDNNDVDDDDDDDDIGGGGTTTPGKLLDFRAEVEVLDLAGSSSPALREGRREAMEVLPPSPVRMGRSSSRSGDVHPRTMSPPPPPPLSPFETARITPAPTPPTAAATIAALPPPRRSPRISLPRAAAFSASSSSTTRANDKSKSKLSEQSTSQARNNGKKKQRIQLRESLAGAWKFVDAEDQHPLEMLDLTGEIAGGSKVHGRSKVRSWRESGVEVLDLTGD